MKLLFLLAFIFILGRAGAYASGLPLCKDFPYDFEKYTEQSELGNIGHAKYYQDSNRKNCQKEWAILVYMAADNDLSPYALWDIDEMEKRIEGQLNLGASGKNSDVLIELDTFMATGIRRLHLFQNQQSLDLNNTIQNYKIKKENEIKSPIVAHFDEYGDYGILPQKERFKKFLQWGITNYPAKKYMVVIWGHGEGYIGHNPPDQLPPSQTKELVEPIFMNKDLVYFEIASKVKPVKFPGSKVFGGVAFDYSDGTYLSIPSIRDILQDTRKQFLNEKPFSVVAFDACLMQTVEVATELKDQTEFLVGSVQIQDYVGLPYRSILDELTKKPSAYDLVKKMVSLASESYSEGGYQYFMAPKARETFTLSALSTSELEHQLLPALFDLSSNLLNYLDEEYFRIFDLAFILENAPDFLGETRELGIFLGTLKRLLYEEKEKIGVETLGMKKLKISIDRALDALHRSLMAYSYGDSYINPPAGEKTHYLLGFFKGLSVWLPESTELFDHRYIEFSKSELFKRQITQDNKSIHWQDWLEKVLGGKGPTF